MKHKPLPCTKICFRKLGTLTSHPESSSGAKRSNLNLWLNIETAGDNVLYWKYLIANLCCAICAEAAKTLPNISDDLSLR